MICFARSILICILALLLMQVVFSQEKLQIDFFPVSVNKKYGFIDRSGKILIEPQFEAVDSFSNGLAKIYVDGKFNTAYIDQTGKIVIPPRFDIGSKFSEGFAWIGFDRDKIEYKIGNLTLYGGGGSHSFNYDIAFINKAGEMITEPIFKFAGDFSEGLAFVQVKNDKFGYIDRSGKFAIEPKFDWANSFSEGLAVVVVKGKYGFIDKAGNFVVAPKYAEAMSFSEGLACVKIGGRLRKPGFGMQFITTSYKDTNYAFIDKAGKVVFKIRAGKVQSFNEGLARFQLFGESDEGFIDNTGKVIIEPKFGGQSDFSDGLKLVIMDQGKVGFIDKRGEIALRIDFERVDDFKNGLAKICESYDWNAKCGYIDKTGKIIWQPTR